jgi:hypothetical protein
MGYQNLFIYIYMYLNYLSRFRVFRPWSKQILVSHKVNIYNMITQEWGNRIRTSDLHFMRRGSQPIELLFGYI